MTEIPAHAEDIQLGERVEAPREPGSFATALLRDPLRPTRLPVAATLRALRRRGVSGPLPPGPVGLPAIGVWPQLVRDPFEYPRRLWGEYGDIFRVPVPLVDMVILTRPDHLAHIMNDRTGRYSMVGPLAGTYRSVVGTAVPMLEGDAFRRRRGMLTPTFGRRNLARLADNITHEFAARLDRWDRFADHRQEVDLQHEIARVTLPAFLRALYSTTMSDRQLEQVDRDIRTMMQLVAATHFVGSIPNLLPLPGVHSLPAAYRRLRRLVDGLVAERRANPIEETDLLGLLMDARYEDGTGLSDKDLSMELIVLMAGGYETVVASLSWTLALLHDNPGAADQLYAEIDELGAATPRMDDLARLTWAKACFDEGQRLQGHPLNPRYAMEDDEIDGYAIPRGTFLGVSLHILHRDPRWWNDPERYDPTRFTDEDVVAARPKLAFAPFGAGPHHCIGSGMAYMNAQFLLAMIFQRYRLNPRPGWRPQHKCTMSTTLDGGLPVTLTRAP